MIFDVISLHLLWNKTVDFTLFPGHASGMIFSQRYWTGELRSALNCSIVKHILAINLWVKDHIDRIFQSRLTVAYFKCIHLSESNKINNKSNKTNIKTAKTIKTFKLSTTNKQFIPKITT